MKIKFKDLLEIAKAELTPLTSVSNPDFRLEQIVYNESIEDWEVVVSFLVENTNKRTNPLGIPTSEFQFHRIYKKLKMNKDNEITGLYMFENKE
jgi:hypothetical protein